MRLDLHVVEVAEHGLRRRLRHRQVMVGPLPKVKLRLVALCADHGAHIAPVRPLRIQMRVRFRESGCGLDRHIRGLRCGYQQEDEPEYAQIHEGRILVRKLDRPMVYRPRSRFPGAEPRLALRIAPTPSERAFEVFSQEGAPGASVRRVYARRNGCSDDGGAERPSDRDRPDGGHRIESPASATASDRGRTKSGQANRANAGHTARDPHRSGPACDPNSLSRSSERLGPRRVPTSCPG